MEAEMVEQGEQNSSRPQRWSAKQMHKHRLDRGIVVAVAGPPHVTQAANDELRLDPFGNGHGRALPPT